MLGSNVERVLKLMDNIIVAGDIDISGGYDLRMRLDNDDVTITTYDSYVTNTASSEVERLTTLKSDTTVLTYLKRELDAVVLKIKRIDSVLYTRKENMHNSVGSPFTEIYRVQQTLTNVVSYSRDSLYIGEYIQNLARLMNMIARLRSYAVDAKWAIVMYADYLERGFNHLQQQDPDTTK